MLNDEISKIGDVSKAKYKKSLIYFSLNNLSVTKLIPTKKKKITNKITLTSKLIKNETKYSNKGKPGGRDGKYIFRFSIINDEA
tara:strand:+ start:139 stop:390 length:252 start_codon:yes stop_codon:yes gene_type:complete